MPSSPDPALRVDRLSWGPLSPVDRRALLHHLPKPGPLDPVIGLFDGHRRVAAALLRLQPSAPEHPGLALGWDAERRAGCACLDGCWVAADWRGHGLYRRLVQQRLQLAQAQGQMRVLALLAPDEHAARHTLMDLGLHVEHSGLWRGLPRQWLLLDRRIGAAAGRAAPLPTRWISADDFDRQCKAAGDGLRGVIERRVGATQAPWIGYMPLPEVASGAP